MIVENNITKIISGGQKYKWGMKGENPNCLVYRYIMLAHQDYKYKSPTLLDDRDNYSELWMGTHPTLHSLVYETNLPISIQLPYLFKVLSVEQALSIQAHPNKVQAIELHFNDPANYPDDNHKPEMAISLDDFQALSGLAPKETIIQNVELQNEYFFIVYFLLIRNPCLRDHIGLELWNQFKEQDYKDEYNIKKIINTILNFDQTTIKLITSNLVLPQSECDSIYSLHQLYPEDVGLIFVLFLNHIRLKEGEAIVLDSGSIHAYLKGNCIECMANSDNVVRAGLTPKFKDKDVLINIMRCELGQLDMVQPKILFKNDCYQIQAYITKFSEFQCISVRMDANTTIVQTISVQITHPSILLCTNGSGILCNDNKLIQINEGETFLIANHGQISFQSSSQFNAYICTSQ